MVSPPLAAFGGAAIAPLRDGYVIVWSEQGRIRAGRLDATLRLTGTMLDLPLYESAGAARRPSVATTGTSVLVAWEETAPSFDGTIIASLSPDIVQLTNGPRLLAIARDDTPRVYAVRDSYSVVQGVVVYTVRESLDVSDISSFPDATSVAVSPFGVATASVRYDLGTPCVDYPVLLGRVGKACPTHATITIMTPTRYYSVHDDYGSMPWTLPLTEAPLLIPNGDGFIVTWRSTAPQSALLQEDGTIAPWWFGLIETPALAGNGSQTLAVWHASAAWSTASLFGALRQEDGTTTAWFPIGNGHDPIVVASGSNRFVVLYQSDGPSNATILAGRIVQLQSPKHRGAS
ncbi:MAG TPA: hypothetical protein VGR95_06750 [Thermoanaerobaculia bacterium]|nr:hypothetical protein [Thermoanaerobaculia bacterium]